MSAIEDHINNLLAQPGLAPETVRLLELAKEANQSGRMPEIPTAIEHEEDFDQCTRCGGEGRVPVHEYHAVMDEMWRTCPACHGTTEGCSR